MRCSVISLTDCARILPDPMCLTALMGFVLAVCLKVRIDLIVDTFYERK